AAAARVAAYRAGVAERLRQAEVDRAAAEARAVEERRRRRAQLAAAGAVLLLLTLGVGGGWWLRRQQVALHERDLKDEVEQARRETERVRQEAELTQAVETRLDLLTRELRQPRPDLPEARKLLAGIEGRLG